MAAAGCTRFSGLRRFAAERRDSVLQDPVPGRHSAGVAALPAHFTDITELGWETVLPSRLTLPSELHRQRLTLVAGRKRVKRAESVDAVSPAVSSRAACPLGSGTGQAASVSLPCPVAPRPDSGPLCARRGETPTILTRFDRVGTARVRGEGLCVFVGRGFSVMSHMPTG